jgi:hypothetical protein
MRVLLALVTGTVLMSALVPAHAEKRIFIITSDSGGYGVDRCLASGGSKCGQAIATSYCKAREFSKALSFRRVDREDITGAIPAAKDTCPRGTCEEFVAIECSR